MLELASWLPQAEALKPGQRRKVPHSCGEDRVMNVEHRVGEGLRAWCYRCNAGGFKGFPPEPLAVRLERLAAQAKAEQAAQFEGLPSPRVYDLDQWPDAAKLWLYKAGLHRGLIGKLRAFYHPPTARVVLPVYEKGEPVFWQARAVDNRVPKYLSPSVDRSKIIPRWGDSGDSVVLVEDILSAFKVGQVNLAWSLMGTKASDYLVSLLVARRGPVAVWLDDDHTQPINRGQVAAAKLLRQLRAAGLTVRNIRTQLDPKLLPSDEIRRVLNEP